MKVLKVLFATSCFGVLAGCQEKDADLQPKTLVQTSSHAIVTDGMTVLGRRLKNPYSVENMRKALENLSPKTRAGITDMDIQPTHYYVKFTPLIRGTGFNPAGFYDYLV